MSESIKRGDFRIVGECVVSFLHRLFPTSDAQPVIVGGWIEKEGFSRRDEELFAWRRSWERLCSFDLVPALLARLGIRPRGPERLKESHGNAPVGQGAAWID